MSLKDLKESLCRLERGGRMELSMKKIAAVSLLTALLFSLSCFTAFGYSERQRSIPSVRITIQTGEIEIGDELSDDADSYVTVPDNQYYTLDDAEWLDDIRSVKVGDEPRMKVYLSNSGYTIEHSDYDTVYSFRGSYNSSNVRVTNGEFISAAKRDGNETLEVTLRIKAIKGHYDEPEDVYWTSSRGVAKWNAPENGSGYYDVVCYRGSTAVKRLNSYHGTSYNFYPYMTKAGEYTVRVRTVAPENVSSSVGKSSDWLESDYLYIEEDQVSDGSGQTDSDNNSGSPAITGNAYPNGTGNANVAGWVQSNGTWYFRYPNGELVRDGWLKLNDKYYMFDAEGRMLTGWQQNKYGVWFYMDKSSGEMKTGWLHDGGYWYYLNTTKDEWEGCMVRGWWTLGDKKYYFNDSGIMVTGWFEIDGKWHYFYPEGSTGGAYGYMAVNTDINGFHINQEGVWE